MSPISVGVLRGGPSSEYEVSLNTGREVLKNLNKEKYRPIDIFIDQSGLWHMNGLVISPIQASRQVDVFLNAMHGVSNFEILFGAGLAIYFMAHLIINFGMNMGILPVTGLVAPFMSYGGSHLLTEFAGLGILMGMRRYRRTAHKDVMQNEFLGI